MPTRLNPYLNFRDTASQAIDFYHSVFGGELSKNTYGEMNGSDDPAEHDKIMHAQLITDNGITLMAADTPKEMDFSPGTNTFAISLSGEDEDELRGYWNKLSDGATITAPLEKAPWGDLFGSCTDKFGVNWLMNINQQPPQS